jgi:hypothetical protein
MNKIDKVKQHLATGMPISGKHAYTRYNYYRLSDGILKLRRRGMQIASEEMPVKDGYYTRYWLIGDTLDRYMSDFGKRLVEHRGVLFVK